MSVALNADSLSRTELFCSYVPLDCSLFFQISGAETDSSCETEIICYQNSHIRWKQRLHGWSDHRNTSVEKAINQVVWRLGRACVCTGGLVNPFCPFVGFIFAYICFSFRSLLTLRILFRLIDTDHSVRNWWHAEKSPYINESVPNHEYCKSYNFSSQSGYERLVFHLALILWLFTLIKFFSVVM